MNRSRTSNPDDSPALGAAVLHDHECFQIIAFFLSDNAIEVEAHNDRRDAILRFPLSDLGREAVSSAIGPQ